MKKISFKTFILAAFFAVLLLPINSRIEAAAPECQNISSNFACPGYTGDITITGENTHFNETSQVSFSCSVITINIITAVSATELRVNISLPCWANCLGACTVEITTGDEIVTCPEGFVIMCCEPACIGLLPAQASPGETLDITSTFTYIDVVGEENLDVKFECEGITVNSVTAINVAEPFCGSGIKANISVSCEAPQCTGSVTITGGASGSVGLICSHAFTVNAPPPCSLTVEPGSLRAGFLFPRLHLIRIKSPNANFTSEGTVEIEDIQILKMLETSAEQIRAVILIPPKYRITKGMKQIKVTTETESLCHEVCTGEIEIK